MKFDDLDARMRVYETEHDRCVPPDVFMVARLDGRGFTRLTKEILDLEAPFDIRMRDHMLATVEHLMDCGFAVLYGYAQSDEISLLFDPKESAFGRKVRKYNSVLAGEGSACLSLLLGRVACLDCRISELPTPAIVVDYFRWRQEDAYRNSLSAWCYWEQRKRGASVRQATDTLRKMSSADKRTFLAGFGIDFDALPSWQRHGAGVLWEAYEKPGRNPVTGETETAVRHRLTRNLELPRGGAYGGWIESFLRKSSSGSPVQIPGRPEGEV